MQSTPQQIPIAARRAPNDERADWHASVDAVQQGSRLATLPHKLSLKPRNREDPSVQQGAKLSN